MASAGPISYTIDLSGGTSYFTSIGPGSFSYDSLGQTSTTIGPPVTLTGFSIPAVLGPYDFAYTQTSPGDDSLDLGPTGLVTALNVDSTVNFGPGDTTLQLNLDGTWSEDATGVSGTYTISPVAAVPEPATLGLLGAGLAAFGLLRRRIPLATE